MTKHRSIVSTLGVAAIAAGVAFGASSAHAGTAWSVSIGGPGYAVAAGAPVYYGPHHWHRAYAAPVVYSAPVVYPAPVVVTAPRVVYAAPVVYRPYVAAPARVVYSRW